MTLVNFSQSEKVDKMTLVNFVNYFGHFCQSISVNFVNRFLSILSIDFGQFFNPPTDEP